MQVIGLTGGIASGKSTVSRRLRELGAVVIDADLLARELVVPPQPAWQEIVAVFGKGIIDEEGNLKRKELADIIFAQPQARKKLNEIMHPRIGQAIRELLREYREKGVNLVVVEAPLLIETGLHELVDQVWVVAVAEEVQLKRLQERDKITLEQAKQRLRAQMPLAEKIKYAHRVIDNSLGKDKTLAQVDSLWQGVMKKNQE